MGKPTTISLDVYPLTAERKIRKTNLQNGRASYDGLVCEIGALARQDDVCLARDAGGDGVDLVIGGAGAADLDGKLQSLYEMGFVFVVATVMRTEEWRRHTFIRPDC